jgi:hypothetical protein
MLEMGEAHAAARTIGLDHIDVRGAQGLRRCTLCAPTVSGVKQPCRRNPETAEVDPTVWTGRALQAEMMIWR